VLTTVLAVSMHEHAVLRRELSNDETELYCDTRGSCFEELVEGLLVVEDLLVVDCFAVVVDVGFVVVLTAARSTSLRSASKADRLARSVISLLRFVAAAVTTFVTVTCRKH
jgi:hypothetical protein